MFPLTPTHLTALRDVAAHRVAYYPGYSGGHSQGYGWLAGGDIPGPEHAALIDLAAIRYIAPVAAAVGGQIACEMVPLIDIP